LRGCTIGSRGEVPGKRKLVIRDDDDDDDDDDNRTITEGAYPQSIQVNFSM
jgi:hypothetical protein